MLEFLLESAAIQKQVVTNADCCVFYPWNMSYDTIDEQSEYFEGIVATNTRLLITVANPAIASALIEGLYR